MAKSAMEVALGHIDAIFNLHINNARNEVKTMLPAIMASALGFDGGHPIAQPAPQQDLRAMAQAAAAASPGKKRGRPKGSKNTATAAPAVAASPAVAAAVATPGKKRGRPPKNAAAIVAAAQETLSAGPADAPKKRGRPKGSKNKGTVAATPAVEAAAATPGKKKRGRPPKAATPAATDATSDNSPSWDELRAKVLNARTPAATN